MRVLVIGGGNMGFTYAQGMSKSKLLGDNKLMILDSSAEKVEELKKNSAFEASDSMEDCLPKADFVFIAVKPYHSAELFKKMKSLVNPGQIVISIMAGVTIETIQKSLGIKKVVRAMPNLPAFVGKGMTSYTSSGEVSESELKNVQTLLNTTG